MKKILFIYHATGWGGAAKSMIELIKHLDSDKYSSIVLLLKDSNVRAKLEENQIPYKIAESTFYQKHYHYFVHSEANYTKWYQLFKIIKLFIFWLLSKYYFAPKELREFNCDIIHLNSSVLTDWLAPAKQKGKTIIHIREPFRKGKFDLLHYFFRHQMKKYADRIIAISKDNARRVGLHKKTTIIYNYADVPISNQTEESYHSNFFLYLGGSAKIKGFYTIVETLNYLDKDVKVYFGGNYASINKKRSLIKRFVRFVIGYGKKRDAAIRKMQNHPNAIEIGLIYDVSKYLNAVCCLISPFSVPHFSRPTIEAHLHKKPVIGSDVEGMDEIIKHNENGIIVSKNNPKALAKAINEICTNSQKAKDFGMAGYNIAIQKYTPKNILEFETLYRELLS